MSAPPVLGSPERPSDGVDTSTVTATCTYCKSPIYFDDIPNRLAAFRKGLDKLTK